MNTQIKGSLAVSCDTIIAGHSSTGGNAEVKGNLKVGGWLDAPNLKTPCKGLFSGEAALTSAYPQALPGWWAFVGTSFPAKIYVADNGSWMDSGSTGGDPKVDLNAYDDALAAISSDVAEALTTVDSIEHPVSLKDTDIADLIIADENENIIATFADGHIRTAKFDSSDIKTDSAGSTTDVTSQKLSLPGKWCAIGTSVTYWDREHTGYQSYIRRWMDVADYTNLGVWGGTIVDLSNALDTITTADIYTIEHGINDWRTSTPVGTIEDFTGDTGNTTFYGAYRKVIDRIYALNRRAHIVLLTPVKACGGYGLPEHTYDAINGVYFDAYVQAIRTIGQVCSLPVADIYAESGINQWNLNIFSADYAIHPNEEGHKRMAAVLLHVFQKCSQLHT